MKTRYFFFKVHTMGKLNESDGLIKGLAFWQPTPVQEGIAPATSGAL